MAEGTSVYAFLEDHELNPASVETPVLLARLSEAWPYPIPHDHMEFLALHGFYNGGFASEAGELRQWRIFDAATVLEELEWIVGDLDIHGLLPVLGQDDTRECLTRDGRYVTVDLTSGDVLQQWQAATLSGLVGELLAVFNQ